MLLQESGSLQGKLTTAVGRVSQPQAFVTEEVVVQSGTRQDLQYVAVDVIVGQTG